MNIVMKLVIVLILWSVSGVENSKSPPRGESGFMREQTSRLERKMDQLIGVVTKLNQAVRSSNKHSQGLMTTEPPAPPKNKWLSHESLITDLNKVKNKQIVDTPFSIGGYTFGLWRRYQKIPDHVVQLELCIYPFNRNNLKWPLFRDMRIRVLDPKTRRLITETTFSRSSSLYRKSEYNKPSASQRLWDSYIILNPGHSIKNWDGKSLIVITELMADSSAS